MTTHFSAKSNHGAKSQVFESFNFVVEDAEDLVAVLGVRDVQRQEIRKNLASVKHQDLAGSNVGDDHKEYFLGEKALLAGGAANTMNQF